MKLDWSALRSRNFRFFLSAQAFALLAGSIQQVALGWLVYRTSHSAMLLGVMGFSSAMPSALLAPFAGVLADRTSPHRVILWTQSLLVVPALLFAFLVDLGHLDVWVVIPLVCMLGIINGIDRPVRQMFLARVVDRKRDIGSAVAFNSLVYDETRIVGSSVGGLVLARFAGSLSFFLAALSQVFAAGLMVPIRPRLQTRPRNRQGALATLLQGLRYALRTRPVRRILTLSALVSFSGASYQVLLPVMAADVLKGGPHTLGFLWGAVGVGAITGDLVFSFNPGPTGKRWMASIGAGLYGAGLLAFSLPHWFWLSLLTLAAAGLGIMMMMTSCSTMLFLGTAPERQGRVLSLFTFSFLVCSPLGSLWAGFLGNHIGAPATIAAHSIVCILTALWFWRNKS